MENKELNIMNIKRQMGRFYPAINWLTEAEAKRANKERDRLLESISGKVNYSFLRNKIYFGKLSPGCSICAQGAWSCMFINGLCTAHCFFCPQDRKIIKERNPFAEEITFDNPEDYVSYLEKFNFKGVAFSGGETLLVFDKLESFIKKIRGRFGRKFYLWIYTNGDLADKNKLNKLRDAGLDEVRFNISARNYDLHCVKLAVNIIKRVTIEIPAIPQDYEKVKRCLKKMQDIGVAHLNIHQLQAYKYNYENFIDRNYTFLHQPGLGIFESEMTALRILKYVLDKKMSLPVNYCSREYKNKFHSKNARQRIAFLSKESFEEVTKSGYIRSLSIQDSPENIRKSLKILQDNRTCRHLWSLNDTRTELFIHGSSLKYLNSAGHNLKVRYFEPQLKASADSNVADREMMLGSKKKLFIKKKIRLECEISSAIGITSFQKLFIDNISEQEVLRYFYRNYGLKREEDLNSMKSEINLLMALKTCEKLGPGFSEIY